jgi:hypothetical protein
MGSARKSKDRGPPAAQHAARGQHSGGIQPDEEHRKEEGEPERENELEDEVEVGVRREDVGGALGREPQQRVNRLGQGQVPQGTAGEEQRHRRHDEQHRGLLLTGREPGHDERPDLVQPDRRRDHHPDEEPDRDEYRERVGDSGEVDQRRECRASLGGHLLDGRFQALEDRVVLPPADARPDDDGDERDGQAVAQLPQVVTEGHPSLGVPLLAEPSEGHASVPDQ